jgi:large subunit ribosomal protein L37Ae
MVSRRKKTYSSIKGLGVKFGATVRKRYGAAFTTLKQKRKCPSCGSLKFKREAIGVWICTKCNLKAAGGAYDIDTSKLNM